MYVVSAFILNNEKGRKSFGLELLRRHQWLLALVDGFRSLSVQTSFSEGRVYASSALYLQRREIFLFCNILINKLHIFHACFVVKWDNVDSGLLFLMANVNLLHGGFGDLWADTMAEEEYYALTYNSGKAIVASRAVDPVGSPSSTTIDQDEQSTSTSPQIRIQSHVTSSSPLRKIWRNDVVEKTAVPGQRVNNFPGPG
ncbi:hypothetical protein Tco_0858188 [Tanacetum coccineum]|uniref:Uncharacterized protein n=1 Tax=Tanacetum coccineum TaxID=301880 RepID=A0ABQ5BC95_9ASTR